MRLPLHPQALEYSLAYEEHDVMTIGSCQIEDTLLNCCQTYCREGNYTYTLEMASGLGKYQCIGQIFRLLTCFAEKIYFCLFRSSLKLGFKSLSMIINKKSTFLNDTLG